MREVKVNERALVALSRKGDHRGNLIAIEAGREVPFEIARVYYVYGTRPGVERGFHAHKEIRQFAVAVRGSCNMVLDDGDTRREVPLDSPESGLMIEPMIWHEMRDFSPDCVLLVLADGLYDETDYIRSYGDFVAAVADGPE